MSQFLGRKALMEKLDQLGIVTTTVEHPEVFTVEQMMPYLQHLVGAHTKNLFMKDKKKCLWLLSTRHDATVILNDVAKAVGASGGLRLADESVLQETLGVRQGCVTAFALINDKEKNVKFIVDSKLIDGSYETIYFHPLENSATTGISPTDFLKFLEETGHAPIRITLN